jgi:hypothetical protein
MSLSLEEIIEEQANSWAEQYGLDIHEVLEKMIQVASDNLYDPEEEAMSKEDIEAVRRRKDQLKKQLADCQEVNESLDTQLKDVKNRLRVQMRTTDELEIELEDVSKELEDVKLKKWRASVNYDRAFKELQEKRYADNQRLKAIIKEKDEEIKRLQEEFVYPQEFIAAAEMDPHEKCNATIIRLGEENTRLGEMVVDFEKFEYTGHDVREKLTEVDKRLTGLIQHASDIRAVIVKPTRYQMHHDFCVLDKDHTGFCEARNRKGTIDE